MGIYYGDLSISYNNGGTDTSDATITSKDVSYGEIAYGAEGKVIGKSPIRHVSGDEFVGGFKLPRVWKDICYSEECGKFVAIAYNSNITAYSTDGITWTESTLPVSANLKSICYGNGKFVIVAYNSNIAAYSDDGITWTTSSLPVSAGWQSVCYGDGVFIAVASARNIVAYSTDGITWTTSSLPAYVNWYSICYGNGKFVAIAYNYNKVAHSTDGITWTTSSLPVSANWYSICYGNGKFVVITQNSNIAAYSTDGITWTTSSLPVSANWYSICYGNDKFVAIAYNSNIAAYSDDGITWTESTLPVSAGWQSVCYGDGKLLAINSSTANIAYSIDGVNWIISDSYVGEIVSTVGGLYLSCGNVEPRKIITSSSSSGFKFEGDYTTSDATIDAKKVMRSETAYGAKGKIVGTAPLSFLKDGGANQFNKTTWSCCYSEDLNIFVAVTGVSSTNKYIYSIDGINWTESDMPAIAKWSSVCYGNGKFIAVAYDSDIAAYSTDGINWIQTTLPAKRYWGLTCYGNGTFVASPKGMSGAGAYSTDGINWTQMTFAFNNEKHSMCFGNGKFVFMGYDVNKAMYSTNGINWNQTTLPISGIIDDVCYGNGKFVAIQYGGEYSIYSEDGITWNTFKNKNQGCRHMTFGNGMFVTFNYSSKALGLISTDGINWTEIQTPGAYSWEPLCYGNGIFIAFTSSLTRTAYSYDGVNWFIREPDSYKLEDIEMGMEISADGCDERRLIIREIEGEKKIMFEDEFKPQNTASISYNGKAASFVKLQTTNGTELLSFLGGENKKTGTFDLTNYIGSFLEIYYDFEQDPYIIKDENNNNNNINTFNYYTQRNGKIGEKKDLFFIEPKNYVLKLNY